MPPLRLLTFTTLFPDSLRPNHGVFVENRLRHLVGTGASTVLVAAPVATRCRSRFSTKMPWFGRTLSGNSVVKVSRRSGVTLRQASPAPPMQRAAQGLLAPAAALACLVSSSSRRAASCFSSKPTGPCTIGCSRATASSGCPVSFSATARW